MKKNNKTHGLEELKCKDCWIKKFRADLKKEINK